MTSRVLVDVVCGSCTGAQRRVPVAEVIDTVDGVVVRAIDKRRRKSLGWRVGQPSDLTYQWFDAVDSYAPLSTIDADVEWGSFVTACGQHGEIVLNELADDLVAKVAAYHESGKRQTAVGVPRSTG